MVFDNLHHELNGGGLDFGDAFRAYRNALHRSGRPLLRAKALALVSLAVQRVPAGSLGRIGFRLWRPGFDFTYSSKKLRDTGFRFKWNSFEEVLLSCIAEAGKK